MGNTAKAADERTKESKAFDIFKSDYKAAKKAKAKGIDKQIAEWNNLYYGKTKVPKNRTRSRFVMKEIAKQIEWQKPNITEPFLSTSHPIRILTEGKKPMEKYINTHFTSTFNRGDFIEQMTDVKLREGTVWVRSGWKTTYETVVEEMEIEEIMMLDEEPDDITPLPNGKFQFTSKKIRENHGTARVCRNEHCFPDPGALTTGEMRFFAEKRLETISNLRATGFYSKAKLDKLAEVIKEKGTPSSSQLEQQRNQDNEEYGQDTRYQPEDDPRKKISIVEYWGFYDLNGDGIAEPVLATWAEDEDILLDIIDNPLPSKEIPYDNDVYSPRPFSLWGNPLAYFIGDNQKVKTGIMRGIVDNMALANNGQKFIKKGTMDYINFKRMREGQKVIEVLKEDGMADGSFNQLPASIFNTLAMVSKESEDLSGVNSGGAALSGDMMSKDDSKSMQMTMAQQRMAAIVRNTSNLLSKVVRHWILMADRYLTNEQIELLYAEGEHIDYNVFANSHETAIVVKVGTDVNRTVKMQQLNMLLQQSKQLGESVPPQTFNKLVAQMFELFDMYEDAKELENYKPEPNPMQQAMQQMELQDKQVDIELKTIKAQTELADAETRRMIAQKGMIEAQSGAMYKQAQTQEKTAKARQTDTDTNMAPAKVLAEIEAAKEKATSRDKI